MINWFLQFAAVIIAAGGIAYGLHLLWRYILCPGYRVLIGLTLVVEVWPVLSQIAEEFKPNEGNTLRDQVDATNLRLGNIEGQMEQLVQHLTVWNGEERRVNDI